MPNGWVSGPKILWLGYTADPAGPCAEIAQIDPRLELLQGSVRGQSFHLNPVDLDQFVARICDPGLQGTIIGQGNQTFRIGIESSGGIRPGDGDIVSQRRPAGRIRKLCQDAIRLVEKDEAAQTGQPLLKALQKRCDSG